jgi:type I restriction enzyme S subunit
MSKSQLSINNYQLPEGYKQTEVGVIPEAWDIKELGNLGSFKNGINKSSEDFGYGSPFVNLMDVFGISSIEDSIHLGLVNSNEVEKKVYDLRKGDVIFIRSSVKPSGVGLTTVINHNLTDTVYSGFLIRFRDNGCLDKDFKKYCFSEERFRQRVIANSTVSANTNINQDNLKKIPIAYPQSIKEQRLIATTLSDVDALIAALDKLIAKKRYLKTATMQQLLTGKKRLPGFGEGKGYKQTEVGVIPEDWNINDIDSLASITTGGRNTQDRVGDGQYPFFVRSQTVERINSYSFDGQAVLTAGDGVGTGKVFHYIDGKFDIHQRVYRISDFRPELDGFFFYTYFSNRFYDRIASMTAKSSVDSVRMEMIADMVVPLPSAEEQRAIATVLSDMDAAIAALETRRTKTQAIKQGMMQQLLTGKVRLV